MYSGLLYSCTNVSGNVNRKKDMERFNFYLDTGSRIYANKNSIVAFADALKYFDSAATIAETFNDDSMRMEASYHAAQAYDAWNKKPLKTLEYYNKARKYSESAGNMNNALYMQTLVIHTYGKMRDTLNVIASCKNTAAMINKMHLKDTALHDQYYTELAFISSNIGDYTSTANYLSKIWRPQYIQDQGINYKSHWMFANANINIRHYKTNVNEWLDSIRVTLARSRTLSDSLFHIQCMIAYMNYLKWQDSADKYENMIAVSEKRFFDKTKEAEVKVSFAEHAVAEAEKDKQIAELREEADEKNKLYAYTSVAVLIIIIIAVAINRKRVIDKNKELQKLNSELDDKVLQNQLLVKEMHHRIKNNLYLIYSLLDMQSAKTENEEAQEQLQAARQRIENIAITHEQLYHNKVEKINLDNYVKDLVTRIIQQSYGMGAITPHITIDETIQLHANKCMLLAMIMNEWLTNTFKYASEPGRETNLYIHAEKDNKNIVLTYSDDGELPDENIKENKNMSSGLGSRIIELLTKQLDGELNKNYNNKPYNYLIKFPAQQDDK